MMYMIMPLAAAAAKKTLGKLLVRHALVAASTAFGAEAGRRACSKAFDRKRKNREQANKYRSMAQRYR